MLTANSCGNLSNKHPNCTTCHSQTQFGTHEPLPVHELDVAGGGAGGAGGDRCGGGAGTGVAMADGVCGIGGRQRLAVCSAVCALALTRRTIAHATVLHTFTVLQRRVHVLTGRVGGRHHTGHTHTWVSHAATDARRAHRRRVLMSRHADVDTRVDRRRSSRAAAARALTGTVTTLATVPQALALAAQHHSTTQWAAQVGVDHQPITVGATGDGVVSDWLGHCRLHDLVRGGYGYGGGGVCGVSGGDWYGGAVCGVCGVESLVDDHAVGWVAECGDVAGGAMHAGGAGVSDGWSAGWVGVGGVVVGGGSRGTVVSHAETSG